jgi:tetratricopeptide (TPR) repeat protein
MQNVIPFLKQRQIRGLLFFFLAAGTGISLFFSFASPRSWNQQKLNFQTIAKIPLTTFSAKKTSTIPVLKIGYPYEGTIFPPQITPPTFYWQDNSAANYWEITVRFADETPALRFTVRGEFMQVAPIDPQCVTSTNEPPRLTEEQQHSRIWKPDNESWKTIQAHSVKSAALLEIKGLNGSQLRSAGQLHFTTSTDKVDALLFYRDVPLMPSENTEGIIQPLPENAMHLIHWRVRDIRRPESHTVLTDIPTCMNCHSFSADGKTMGIDLDGPGNDKGLYAITAVEKQIRLDDKHVVQWNADGRQEQGRVGFMSQLSPDGRYVVSGFAGSSLRFHDAYYVQNYSDYHFLQVFYPTRSLLEIYDRQTGRRQPLPGADDPQYVQTGGVWSPDGKWIVFVRAKARDPYDKNKAPAIHANDPHETQIQYDLYRVPFNNGKGGKAERIDGASANGMSNSFPKVSPDGKWIVFVEARNAELMRPDSKLYIVPFDGGVVRPLKSNMDPMNSWHSWSPNSRWLVFSSKGLGPYTKMFLTHIDAEGNSSPAVLIDNATASNRAVNLPEFVNTSMDGIENIEVPAIDIYRLMEKATNLENQKDYSGALAVLRQANQEMPDDARIQNDMATVLYYQGDVDGAIAQVRKAIEINPRMIQLRFNLGAFLLHEGRTAEALPELEEAQKLNPGASDIEEALALANFMEAKPDEALRHYRRVLELNPRSIATLVGATRILSSAQDAALRNGAEAVELARRANEQSNGKDATILDVLGAAWAETGDFENALEAANHALVLATQQGNSGLAEMISIRIQLYQQKRPYRK